MNKLCIFIKLHGHKSKKQPMEGKNCWLVNMPEAKAEATKLVKSIELYKKTCKIYEENYFQ